MSSSQGAKKGKSYVPAVSQITVNTLRMSSQDIATWKTAVDSARNPRTPRRRLLYDLYDSIVLDGHLSAVMMKRVTNITNKRVTFIKDGDEGATDDVVRDTILEAPWFHQLNKIAMSSKAYGHALIELIPTAGEITEVRLVNRANVIPERQMVAWNYANPDNGFNYITDQPFSNYLIEVGGRYDYGLLMMAAQYVIYKRGGFGDWAQFAELFGMPFRVGEYDPYDDTTRKKLDEGLKNMGGAGYATIPKGTAITFHSAQGTAGASSVYKDLIDISNAEISKIFLGNTLTTEAGTKGARSLGDVHKDVEEMIGMADMIEHEYMLNTVLKPKLEALGYPVAGGRFRFEKMNEIPKDVLIDIALKVSSQVEVDENYWYETFNIPKPSGDQSNNKPDPNIPADPTKKKS